MRMRFAVAALALATLSTLAVGCGLSGQSKPARAQEAALELNLNARFGRMEIADEHVAPKAHEKFFESRKGWGGSVRIADYDLTGLRMKGEDDCESFVKVAWYRANEGDLRVTTIRQKWHDFKGDWKLTEEERIDGDIGLLNEAPAIVAAASGTPTARHSQFPSVHLGNGGDPEAAPTAQTAPVAPPPETGPAPASFDEPAMPGAPR
jgi:hypothetical protein